VALAPDVDSVRALENSLADLEALIGNRVNIQSVEMGETWRIPQPFRYGWCLMLGTKSLPLGTIWLFFSQARSPQPSELTLLDGLATQLYEEISSRDKPQQFDADASLLQQELILAARSNDARLPAFAPEIDGWKIAGWTYRQGYLSSTFHDWAVTPSGNLSIAVGQVVGPMLTSAMSLNNLRSLISAHRDYRHSSETLSAKLNEQIWCHSPGDEMASLIYALVDPETDQINLVNAGDGGVVFHGPQGVQSIDTFLNPLGVDLESQFEAWNQVVDESQTIVMFTQGLRHAISETMPTANDADLLRTILLANPGQPQAILAEIEERFFSSDFQHIAGDLSVIVLSRSSTAPDLHQVAAEVSQSIVAELRGDDRDLLVAWVESLENSDDWDRISNPGSDDRDAADFDQHWSADDLASPLSEEEGDINEGEPDEEIEPDPSAAGTEEGARTTDLPSPDAGRPRTAVPRNTNSGKGKAQSKGERKPRSQSKSQSPSKSRSRSKSKGTTKGATKDTTKGATKATTKSVIHTEPPAKPPAKPKPKSKITAKPKTKSKSKDTAKTSIAAQSRSTSRSTSTSTSTSKRKTKSKGTGASKTRFQSTVNSKTAAKPKSKCQILQSNKSPQNTKVPAIRNPVTNLKADAKVRTEVRAKVRANVSAQSETKSSTPKGTAPPTKPKRAHRVSRRPAEKAMPTKPRRTRTP
jgi:serine phosphatase RsbU (regulator of sigma subunit)